MTKREAKRRICRMASSLLEGRRPLILEDALPDETPADDARLTAALEELIQELFDRGREPHMVAQPSPLEQPICH